MNIGSIKNNLINKVYSFRGRKNNLIRINKIQNAHKGKRAFLIGSGPSLKVEDLDKLSNEITFGCNKIYLAFDTIKWRPTYYTVTDTLVARNNKHIINELNLNKIFTNFIRKEFWGSNDITWLKELPGRKVNGKRVFDFSTDVSTGVYGGYSVIYTMLQIGYYMGISEFYLLGIDFSFSIPKLSEKKSPIGETIVIASDEKNHFDSRYREPGEEWTYPQLELQYDAFKKAKEAFEASGRKIFNASRTSKLDVFERVNLDDVI